MSNVYLDYMPLKSDFVSFNNTTDTPTENL